MNPLAEQFSTNKTMGLLKYETKGPTIVNARWGVPDEKEVDVTQSFIDIFKNNHSSYILYDHNPNQFNELEEDPLPGVVKVLTVVYCEEGSRKKKCCTLYEHESNTFPNGELASEEEEEEEKIKKVSKLLKKSKKSKQPKKKDLIEDGLYE